MLSSSNLLITTRTFDLNISVENTLQALQTNNAFVVRVLTLEKYQFEKQISPGDTWNYKKRSNLVVVNLKFTYIDEQSIRVVLYTRFRLELLIPLIIFIIQQFASADLIPLPLAIPLFLLLTGAARFSNYLHETAFQKEIQKYLTSKSAAMPLFRLI